MHVDTMSHCLAPLSKPMSAMFTGKHRLRQVLEAINGWDNKRPDLTRGMCKPDRLRVIHELQLAFPVGADRQTDRQRIAKALIQSSCCTLPPQSNRSRLGHLLHVKSTVAEPAACRGGCRLCLCTGLWLSAGRRAAGGTCVSGRWSRDSVGASAGRFSGCVPTDRLTD